MSSLAFSVVVSVGGVRDRQQQLRAGRRVARVAASRGWNEFSRSPVRVTCTPSRQAAQPSERVRDTQGARTPPAAGHAHLGPPLRRRGGRASAPGSNAPSAARKTRTRIGPPTVALPKATNSPAAVTAKKRGEKGAMPPPAVLNAVSEMRPHWSRCCRRLGTTARRPPRLQNGTCATTRRQYDAEHANACGAHVCHEHLARSGHRVALGH